MNLTNPAVLRGVVDATARWLRLRAAGQNPRINLRTDVVPPEGLAALQDELAAEPEIEFIVRTSRALDAVRMRNAPTRRPTVYVVLWQEGTREHAANAESLRTLHRVDTADVLGEERLVLAEEGQVEAAVRRLCSPAATEHVLAAWRGLRIVLRDPTLAVPFASRLDAYVDWLVALSPETAHSLPELVERWGAELPRLGLFRFPAIGPQLGLRPEAPDAEARRRERRWEVELRAELGMNQTCALDFAHLADRVAGRGDLKLHLEELGRQGLRLGARDPEGARRAFEAFCRSGDRDALALVDWAWQDEDRRTQGLRGLLVQRRLSSARRDPLLALQADTQALLSESPVAEFVPGQIARFKQAPDYDSPLRRLLAALAVEVDAAAVEAALDELGVVDPPRTRELLAGLAGTNGFTQKMAGDLARRWAPQVAARGEVRHARLLEGLLQVLANRLEDGALPEGRLMLRALTPEEREHAWDGDLDALGTWLARVMATHVAAAREEGEEPSQLRVQVAAHGAVRIVLGEIELGGEAGEDPPDATVAVVGFGEDRAVEAKTLGALQTAWQAHRRGWRGGRSPLGAAAGAWYRAWAEQVAAAGDGGGAATRLAVVKERLDVLNEELAAFDERDEDPPAALQKEKKELRAERRELEAAVAAATGPVIDDQTCRELLQVCTTRDRHTDPALVELDPHHPLCLRLRAARERLMVKVIEWLRSGHVAGEGLDQVRRWAAGELDPVDLPPPIQVWSVGASRALLFDGWRPGGAARFRRPDQAGQEELDRLGIAPMTRIVRDYRQIFARGRPAETEDRLQVALGGDADGSWAWALVERMCKESGVELDVALTRSPPLPARPRYLEEAAYAHADLFTPRRDGRPPRVRYGTTQLPRPHLALDLGERLGFGGEFRSFPAGPVSALTDEALLFSAPRIRLEGSALAVADPPDAVLADVRRLVERVGNGRGAIWAYDFDPDQHGERLRAAQGEAHWLVLASRFPVHRAVKLAAEREERAGRPFANLIDFQTTSDRGRPLYLSCSLHAGGDGAIDNGLSAALDELGLELELDAVLRAARSVAPKAALALLRGSYLPEIQGILGLLLTAAHARTPGERLLALDQHIDLLGKGHEFADLVGVRREGEALVLRVYEAKLSKGALTPGDSLAQKGRAQVTSTVTRLRHFEEDHPLAARTRRRLVDALADAADLAGEDAASDPLVTAASDLGLGVRVEGPEHGWVHAWALEGPDALDHPAASAPIIGEATRQALRRLTG